jgi:hypothetical protein
MVLTVGFELTADGGEESVCGWLKDKFRRVAAVSSGSGVPSRSPKAQGSSKGACLIRIETDVACLP